MAQAKVTDFYAHRRSSRKIETRTMKRRKLSSSSDSSLKEVPSKRSKPEHHVQAIFQDIEDNCTSSAINIGKSISFHDFTQALNSRSKTISQTKSTVASGRKDDPKPRGRKKQETKGKVGMVGKPQAISSSTLEQYLAKKQVTDVDVGIGKADKIKNSKEACLTPLEKTPTKRGHDQTRVPVRRKKAKEIFSEESGYSSQSSVSDNQPNERSKRMAKRCLGSQFQNGQSLEAIGTTQSSISGQDPSENGRVVTPNLQKVKVKPAPTKERKERVVDSALNKSPLKDRIRQTLANQLTEKPDGGKGQKIGTRKLSPEEVKAKLANCGKLEELQAVLGRVKRSTQVKRDEVKKPERKAEELPAYKKYRHLAVAAPPSLLLPLKYKTLEEMFQSTDTVVSMLHNRSEGCSFSKLKAGVQELCRKTFQPKNLGQIKKVYPASYRLYQQKSFQPISKRGKDKNGGYELMVEADLNEFSKNSVSNPGNISSNSTMKDIHSQSNFLSKFTPSALITRRTIFHSNLVEIVKEQHKEFLQKQNPPLAVPDDKITRWHPKFPLENITDIDPSPLPQPPNFQTYSTAKDVLNKARDLMNPKVAKALELIANKNEEKQSEPASKPRPEKPADESKTKKVPSGISSDLLERIRAKEARNLQAAMMRSEVDEERIGMLERLPELCLIVRGLFLAEKKAALTVDVVIQKVGDSCKTTLSQGQLEKHLELMKEILPDWMTSIKIRKETYLKINKKKELKELTNQITKVLKEEKRK